MVAVQRTCLLMAQNDILVLYVLQAMIVNLKVDLAQHLPETNSII